MEESIPQVQMLQVFKKEHNVTKHMMFTFFFKHTMPKIVSLLPLTRL